MKTALLIVGALMAAGCATSGRQRSLENGKLWVEIQADGSVRILDKLTGGDWVLGSPRLVFNDGREVKVTAVPKVERTRETVGYAEAGTRFTLRMNARPAWVEYSAEPAAGVREVVLVDEGLKLGSGEDNYYVIPKRLGILVPVAGEKPFTRRYPAYRRAGYSMAMFGAVRHGLGLLADWEDPYTDLVVRYEPKRAATPRDPEREAGLALSVSLRESARKIRLRPLGKAGYVEIARAYREIAREKGYLKTLAEKAKENPKVARLFGAADFKPFAYMPLAPKTRWNPSDKPRVQLNFTFDECAQLAEHFRNDLGIDRAMLVLNGWIRGGYDNLHPDILPAAAAIGGDEGLAACSRRVKALGWLFGLHDNYQDMYREAPSWDESFLIQEPDGKRRAGGVWAGGQCWLICSRKSVELAARPQNVPGVVKLCAPDLYFSDTIFAAGLYECHDPAHPTTLAGDIVYKRKLCDYIRGEVGLFGSEEGREWGVPHAEYFEGLLSQRTGFQRDEDDEIVVPLFEMVFGDAVLIYAHQSDRPRPDEPDKILHHILYAEMPVYYFGTHTYWKDSAPAFVEKPESRERLLYAQGGGHNAIDRFIRNTYAVVSPLHRLTALAPMTDHRFLSGDRQVEFTRFGSDVEIAVNHGAAAYTYAGATLPRYGFVVNSPTLVSFCATEYQGIRYDEPTMYVIESLDGKPVASSGRVRVRRIFGGNRLRLGGEIVETDEEQVVSRG